MHQKVNEAFAPLFTTKKRYYILMGGRGAGRSKTAAQYALAKLVDTTNYFRCAIMRFIRSDIRKSIYQDILDTAEEQEVVESIAVKNLSFEYGKNAINGLSFRKSSSDQRAKLKSIAGYTCVIIEEADEVPEEDFLQLDDSIRTTKGDIAIILLLNPPHKNHWIIKRWFNLVQAKDENGNPIDGFYEAVLKEEVKHNTVHIHSTYLDNLENIDQTTRDNFEGYKEKRPDHYYNMIKGLVSEGMRGRIFKNWKTCTDAEFEALPYPSYYGLDFGFSNDPTALVEIKEHNLNVWVRELIYEPGLTNRRISQKMEALGVSKDAPIYADSAEPKSIAEIAEDGWNILPAPKGPDSINAGIDWLLERDVSYTETSENIAIENQEYRWALDKNKEPINKPIDEFNHAMDALRYGTQGNASQSFVGFV